MAYSNQSTASLSDDEQEEYIDPNDVVEEIILDDADQMDEDDLEGDENGEDGAGEGQIIVEDNSISHFSSHQKAVFGLATHPTFPLAVSGAEDDTAFLWDTSTGEEITSLGGHTDTVVSVGFSFDGALLATGGMDGKIRVYKRVGEDWKKWEFLIELLGPDEIVWLQWHPKGQVLVAAGVDSTVWMWQLPSGQTMQVFSGHTEPVNAGTFTPDGKRLLTGSADGSLILWDPRSASPLWKLTSADARFAMEGGVISLAVNSASTLAVVGGHGEVRVVNLAKGEVLGKLEGHQEESVEAVAFMELSGGGGANSSIAVTGGTDGKVCVWDLNTMRLRASSTHADAVTSLVVHPAPTSHLITSASVDGTLKTWDARTGTLVREHTGHRGPVHVCAVGSGAGSKQVVISGGDEGICLVFDVE